MVKKKEKSSKSTKRRGSWQNEEVHVNTGLPPQVEGQLRCFCRLSIGQILWHSPHPPDVAHVRVKWWGEDGDGAVFCPPNVKKDTKAQTRTTARYPVRSGPKQFASYLNDMGSLILEVLSGPMMVPIGQAEVTHVGLLSPTRPVNGSVLCSHCNGCNLQSRVLSGKFYPVISPREDKIAELQVSLMLESLMASYDSTGSIPTTDISMDTHATQESMYPQKVQPIPHSQAPRKPVDDPFISPASQNVQQNGYVGTADDLRKQLNYSIHEAEERQLPAAIQSGSTVAITTNGDVVTTNLNVAEHHQSQGINEQQIYSQGQVSHSSQPDLLSVLLDRGNRLRDQMVISTINDDQTVLKEPFITHASGTDAAFGAGINIERRSSTGSLLREILKAEKTALGGNVSQLDDKAVDLVFGGHLTDDLQVLKMMGGSPRSSVSEDVDLISDPGDPIHSESILQELFYKNPESEVSGLSDLSGDEDVVRQQHIEHQTESHGKATVEDPDNVRPPSRRSSCSSLTFPEFPDPPQPLPSKEKKKERSRTPKRKFRLKLKRKGSKKRRRSQSSGASGGSDISDNEQLSTPRSEVSQVSFDMPASDIDEPEQEAEPLGKKKTDGLSVERLTLLGRVHVARVVIDTLHVNSYDLSSSLSRKKSKTKTIGKPPKPSPKAKKSVTYFIEYQFPVVATSRDKYSPNAMATEVMRVASKNVKDGVVTFSHRSVFPIMFNGSAVEKWWKSALIFKLYSRTAGQKVPSLVGSCGIPLKSILKSDNLHVDKSLEIRESGRGNTSLNSSVRSSSTDSAFGSLKIGIELASDSRDFSSALARAKLAEMSGKAKIVPISQAAPPPPPPPVSVRPPLPPESVPSATEMNHVQPQVLSELPPVPNQELGYASNMLNSHPLRLAESVQQQYIQQSYPEAMQSSNESMTLHTLLLIPEGQNITLQGIPSLQAVKRHPVFPPQPHSLMEPGIKARDASTRNAYLVCRMFWCNDAVHSNVCWGSFQPQFNFVQIAPVLMSPSLLERMRNNYMVVEVWDKKTSAENDKLIGIVKLSLHQFYMSFRDRKISTALLKSQFPVISVDTFLPVIDPLSGSQFGQIKVLLAMGSAEQVAGLQRLKVEGPAQHVPERPQHYLERQDMVQQYGNTHGQAGADGCVEHLFEIVMEGIRGLLLFENMIWGEADCFIQYHFPVQSHTEQTGAPTIKHGIPSMKSFRTTTTLCIPDPTFNDITRHRLVLPQTTPVQRELLTACAGSGGGGGGIPFEVWCRYYHPNIRDQCIAKASLPLAKLCAMITMQKRGEPSVQSFTLQLTHVAQESDANDPESRAKMKESGQMDVTVHYRTHVLQSDNEAANKNLTGSQVCLSVGVIRASGLKAAAEAVARLDSGMQYPSEVGINAYVKVIMSFLGKGDERITRTIARTFAPEFSHHMDFPCPLLWTEADNDALALAEILETAEVTLEVWHQVPGLASDIDRQFSVPSSSEIYGKRFVDKTGDVLLGTTVVPLSSLLTHRTGILGWYALNLPSLGWNQNSDEEGMAPCNHGLERVVGGLELSIKFAHHNDRERVIHAGRGVGWSPVDLDVEDDEDWQSEDEDCGKYDQISVSMDHMSFPLQNALIAGQSQLDRTAKCYVRYKLYDRNAVVSKTAKLEILDSGYILSHCNHRHDFHIPISSPFKWYLREEKLEVQVWVSYGRKEQKQKPQHRDKLIGTAYIDMESLSDERRRQHRVSGMYPLFKPGASSLGGAFLRAHITAKPHFGNVPKESDVDDERNLSAGSDDDIEYDSNDSFHQLMSKKKPAKSHVESLPLEPVPEDNVVPSFSVIISVERAMHLPHINDKNRSEEYLPNTYVSYQTAESLSPSYTQVFFNTDNPVWDHQLETKLSTELLYQENKNLVFKVWHKPHSAPKDPDKSCDRVLGFVSVDLTPLASGLMQICGWYNVMDFNGQCRGQIKVNVVPQENVTRYREGIQAAAVSSSTSVNQPSSLPYEVNAPLWLSDQPMSLPANFQPFSSNLPQFDQHVDVVREQHEQLQNQLTDHIRQFLQRQEAVMAQGATPAVSSAIHPPVITAPTSLPYWQPSFPEHKTEDSNACSRSIMFTSLRKQMQDLDDITSRLKMKLGTSSSVSSCPHDQALPPVEDVAVAGLGHMTMTSTQSGISPLSSLQFTSTRKHENESMQTGSQGEGESSQTVVDSGAFSVTHSSEKYLDHDAPDSQRSGSDKLDTLPLGTTPRDYTGHVDSESNMNNYGYSQKEKSTGSTPRDSQNNSDTGVNMHFTPRDDISVSTGGFNMGYTPRDPGSLGETPRDTGIDVNYNASHVSDPSSLGFLYQGETGSFSSTTRNNTSHNGSLTSPRVVLSGNPGKNTKDMSIIQEYTENEEDSEGGEDEKYYHQYRDILDEQENSSESEDEKAVEDEGEVVVPRTLNDVSGKFGGIPGHSVVLGSASLGSPREFHQSSSTNGEQTMPFDVRISSQSSRFSKDQGRRELDDEDDITEQFSSGHRLSPHNEVMERPSFVEKDSWFSDDDKDNESQHHSASERTDHPSVRQDVGNGIRTDSAKGSSSRGSSPGSCRSCATSDHSVYSAKGQEVHSFPSGFKSAKEAYSEVVTELEDFFSHPQDGPGEGHLKSRSPSLSSVNSGSRPHSPVSRGDHQGHESDDHLPDNVCNGYQDIPNGDVNGLPKPSSMPNFFMPVQHLEESMKALQMATSAFPSSSHKPVDMERQAGKIQAAAEMRQKLESNKTKYSATSTKGRQPPTAAETMRIAKIFSAKFT